MCARAVLVANKCEGQAGNGGLYEAFELGLGEPVPISAEHGEGMVDLFEVLSEAAEEFGGDSSDDPDDSAPLQLAIVGRPNVGKSTLVNRLIREERLLTGPEAGITRMPYQSIGSIAAGGSSWLIQRVSAVGRVSNKSSKNYLPATRTAPFGSRSVVVLVLDGDAMLERQDLTIARRVIEEGRALVIAANKWDAVEDQADARQRLRDRLETSLPQVKGVPVIHTSGLHGRNLDKLLDAVFSIYEVWNRRIPTSPLNDWLVAMIEAHPPPLARGRRIRIRYMTQIKTRPPTFALWVSQPTELPDAYLRYLENGMRKDFELDGVPLRLQMRKGESIRQGQLNAYTNTVAVIADLRCRDRLMLRYLGPTTLVRHAA